MNCPKCHGTGIIQMHQLNHAHVEGALALRPTKCDYEGCINGITHCCDGLTENGEFNVTKTLPDTEGEN